MKKIKRFKRINWKAIVIAVLVTGLAWAAWAYLSSRTNQAQTLRLLEKKQVELNIKLKELDKTKLDTQQLEKTKQDLETQKADLQKQLEAKRARQAADKVFAATLPASVLKPVVAASGGCRDPKSCIYSHESGGRTNAINASSGACGLGQALPCSKMGCSLSDYACQDAYFEKYCLTRYGSWEAAWQFWQKNHWW